MKRYLDVCRKLQKADLVLKNAKILNVFTKEWIEGDLAICDGRIIGIGSYVGVEEQDLSGRFVVPGFIDSHIHIESSMISPYAFSHTVLPFGTTTLIADPHEIANVSGLNGIRYMLKESENLPVSIYYMMPSCVPATPMESSGAILEAEDLQVLMDHPRILGLGEMMNFPGVLFGDPNVHAKLKVAGDKVIDGHAPGLKGDDLVAYAFSGIQTDHECSEMDEVLQRLRLGMAVQIRKGSAANNLYDIVSELVKTNLPLDRCVFCTDDKHIEHIFKDGHINSNIRESIALGIDPIEAICMATYYPARLYHLNKKGALAPGYDADLVIFDDLQAISPTHVMTNGNWQYIAGENVGSTLLNNVDRRYEEIPGIFNSVNCDPIKEEDLVIPLVGNQAYVMGLIDFQILTSKLVCEVPTEAGHFKANETYSKLAVFERHHRTGQKGLAIIKNFNIRKGAIAQTIAHDSHNIVCVGDNDQDMVLAVNTLIEKQGGIVIVSEGKVVDHLNLPIAGLMSHLSASQVTDKLAALLAVAKTLGINDKIDPFLTLAFMALPVIPELKLTDRGLFDVGAFKHIPIQPE
ncbi:adenine deaminase [Niameybacter massiliensis]|uniref:adenine deaminase n=1 Tax=Niameybacter massiliensis TaxID=1658108 RepID=UPI0006B60C02|nr:adenine deaminase [Niameybacter massiliensis]